MTECVVTNGAHILLGFIAGLFGLLVILFLLARYCSPLGWEDADGWHPGQDPREHIGIGGGADRINPLSPEYEARRVRELRAAGRKMAG